MYCYPVSSRSIGVEQFKKLIETEYIGGMLKSKTLYGELFPDLQGDNPTRICTIHPGGIGFRIDRFIYAPDSVSIFIEPVDTAIGRMCRGILDRMMDTSSASCIFIPRLFTNKDTDDSVLVTVDMHLMPI